MSLDTFTAQYWQTALWLSTAEDGETPMDRDHTLDDVAPDAIATGNADCAAFYAANTWPNKGGRVADALAGHDFWLTRNRHGAGFWDGDYPDDDGQRLTDASHAYGECDLYVGDDGKVYTS